MSNITSTIHLIYSYYKYVNSDISDPRTSNWFLIGSPWGILAIIGFYLYFTQVLGPAFMAKRQPYNLKNVMVIFNITQILLNAYVGIEALRLGWFWKFKLICEPVNYSYTPDAMMVASVVWLYYIVKLIDLLDTVFFILRKKENQITFLHVYHHAGMTICTWAATKYLPGGHGTFLGVINSFVHVVMYTHYLLTSLKLGRPWWKKYITQLQLFQFFTIVVHFSFALMTKDCAYPKWPIVICLPQNLFMMILFYDFYYKTYMKKKPAMVNKNGVSDTTESEQKNVELSNGKSKLY